MKGVSNYILLTIVLIIILIVSLALFGASLWEFFKKLLIKALVK